MRRFLLCLALLVPFTHAQSPTLAGDPDHPAVTRNWVETQLFFGLGAANGEFLNAKGVTESLWLMFLDREVTPRFPNGLSVADLYGQWRGPQRHGKTKRDPERIRSKLLIILYPATPENFANIEAIRAAWKQLTGDKSVLKVTQPADVSF